MYDMDSNLRAKDWNFVKSGNKGDIWKTIGMRAGLCLGGEIQRAKGWRDIIRFDIQDYIKLYRSKMRNAKPLETFLNKYNINSYIYVEDKCSSEKIVFILKEFIRKYNMDKLGRHYVLNIKNIK